MKIEITLVIIAILFFGGCKGFKKGQGDMYYNIIQDKSGATIKEYDFVALTFSERTEDNSLLTGTYVLDRPMLAFREKSNFQGDFFSALGLLSAGDSAIFKINIDSIIKKNHRQELKGVKGKYLIYSVRVNNVIARGNLSDSLFSRQIEKLKDSADNRAAKEEPRKLLRYISVKKIHPSVSGAGLRYIVIRLGKGPVAAKGDSVIADYSARYLSGKVFETTIASEARKSGIYNHLRPYEPVRMILNHKTSSGFDEGLSSFPQGTKVELIIPSRLAYGKSGYQGTPPYTPVICDLEILKIIHKGPQGE